MPAQVVYVQQHPDTKFAGGPKNYGNPEPMNYVQPETMGMSTNGGQGIQMVTPDRAYNNGNEDEW